MAGHILGGMRGSRLDYGCVLAERERGVGPGFVSWEVGGSVFRDLGVQFVESLHVVRASSVRAAVRGGLAVYAVVCLVRVTEVFAMGTSTCSACVLFFLAVLREVSPYLAFEAAQGLLFVLVGA